MPPEIEHDSGLLDRPRSTNSCAIVLSPVGAVRQLERGQRLAIIEIADGITIDVTEADHDTQAPR